MESTKEQEHKIKSGLYSSKQLYITALTGGPSIAGFIIACNLWARDKKLMAIIPVIPGLLLGFAILFLIDYSAPYITSFVIRHILAIVLYFLLLLVFALIIRFILKKNNKIEAFIFPEINSKIFHPRKIYPVIIISIIYFLAILTFNIYLWTVLGFYLFTHFYAYILIHRTFGSSKIANWFLVSVIILACLLPFTDATGQIISVYWGKKLLSYTYLNLLVGYYTIFVFYLFLIILGLNLLLLINRMIRIVQQKRLKNNSLVFATILLAIISGATILVIGTHINNNPVIKRYSVSVPAKSSELKSLKVISVSDLHLKNITSTTFLKKLVNKITMSNPDIILLPGDIAETYGNTTKEKLNEFIEILKDLKSEYGVYAIKGNHDFPGVSIADKIDFNKRLGLVMLADSLIEIDTKVCIIGLNYRGNNEKRPIDSLLRFRTKDLPIILLDHAPYCLEEAVKNKIDVQLSGHTHNGQIWPLNNVTDALYDVAWGYKNTGCTHLFVSCGVQDALLPGRQDLSIPIRIGSVSEILEINIEFR